MTMQIDWEAISSALLSRVGQPALVLTPAGTVQLANAAAAGLVDRPLAELRGRAFGELLASAAMARTLTDALALAARGMLDHVELELCPKNGEQLSVRASLTTLGQGQSTSILLTVTDVWARPWQHAGDPDDARFDISIAPGQFGTIRCCWSEGRPAPQLVGKRCYEIFAARDRPCTECPSLGVGESGAMMVQPARRAGALRVVTARRIDGDTVQMTTQVLGEEVLAALLRARTTTLAETAALTTREREILDLLLLGRSQREIAIAVGLSVRTVKFHQKNLLAKLGAESRLDLLRLLT